MKVGWEFISWTSTKEVRCNIEACRRVISSGHVRVDRAEPTRGDPVLCVDCWGLISAGVDPDPRAAVPEWEQKNRDERLREITNGNPHTD